MKIKLPKILFLFCSVSLSITSQNLLNTNSWATGSGSVSGFNQNGSTSENIREFGLDTKRNSVLLWKAVPDSQLMEKLEILLRVRPES